MKLILQLAFSLMMIASAFAKAPAPSMPSVSGKDLNGKPWTVPGDLPGNHTLVLIGFDELQQQQIETWTKGLALDQPANAIPWIEMPLIDNPGMFMRWFINTGMRGGILGRRKPMPIRTIEKITGAVDKYSIREMRSALYRMKQTYREDHQIYCRHFGFPTNNQAQNQHHAHHQSPSQRH